MPPKRAVTLSWICSVSTWAVESMHGPGCRAELFSLGGHSRPLRPVDDERSRRRPPRARKWSRPGIQRNGDSISSRTCVSAGRPECPVWQCIRVELFIGGLVRQLPPSPHIRPRVYGLSQLFKGALTRRAWRQKPGPQKSLPLVSMLSPSLQYMGPLELLENDNGSGERYQAELS